MPICCFFVLLILCYSHAPDTLTSYSLNASASQRSILPKSRMFRVRRTFLLIVTFDLIFMVLLWIIYNQVCLFYYYFLIFDIFQILNITIDAAFQLEVIHYSIKTSLFDVVVSKKLIRGMHRSTGRWSHYITKAPGS